MKEFSLPFGPLSSQHCAFCICIMHQARLPHQQEYLFNLKEQPSPSTTKTTP